MSNNIEWDEIKKVFETHAKWMKLRVSTLEAEGFAKRDALEVAVKELIALTHKQEYRGVNTIDPRMYKSTRGAH